MYVNYDPLAGPLTLAAWNSGEVAKAQQILSRMESMVTDIAPGGRKENVCLEAVLMYSLFPITDFSYLLQQWD